MSQDPLIAAKTEQFRRAVTGPFSGLTRRVWSFACGSGGCHIRVEGPSRDLQRKALAITDRVADALKFSGLTVEEFLLVAEFCQTIDTMALTYQTLDAALDKIAEAGVCPMCRGDGVAPASEMTVAKFNRTGHLSVCPDCGGSGTAGDTDG